MVSQIEQCKALLETVRKVQSDLLEMRDVCRDFVETSVESPYVFEQDNIFYYQDKEADSVILSVLNPVHLRFYDSKKFNHRSEFYPVALIPRESGVGVVCRIYDEKRHKLSERTLEFMVEDIDNPEELLSFILRCKHS